MIGQESTEEKIRKLEKEISELRQAIQSGTRREEILLDRLKEYENAFYSELNAQGKVYKQTWTWRIGRLFVEPAEWILNLFRSKKKEETDRTTLLKNNEDTVINGQSANQEDNSSHTFPGQATDPSKENIAVIFDTFTQSCFSPEFNTIRFTPSTWMKVLGSVPVSGLIIESAWNGNGGSWADQVANLPQGSESQLVKLTRWAKKNKIPTIFWNKEDPVHFDQFIEAAKHCDYIFTTDAGCIDAYRKHAPGAEVRALPFAAQPGIHNPLSEAPRIKSVCFAGTYYGHRYHERKADMDFLLKPSLEYGLEIYDRNLGDTRKYAENLRFPETYRDAIKGRLDYDDMLKAYKQYKVFLNVNSVRYSPTMCARRVFELLACGTPVISNYSKGIINLLGEGTVLISESEEDTRKHLDYLLGDELNWWKASLNGLRKVMQNHTYAERTKYIFDITGLKNSEAGKVKFSIVSRVKTMNEVRYLERMIRLQNHPDFDIILTVEGETIHSFHFDEIKSMFAPLVVKIISINDDNLETKILSGSDSTHLAFFHAGKYYGPNYLSDFSIALKYADPGIMGKKSTWRLEEGGSLTAIDPGSEYKYANKVHHATSIHRKNTLDSSRIMDYTTDGYNQDEKSRILSIDPFNYLDSILPLNEELFNNPVLDKINL